MGTVAAITLLGLKPDTFNNQDHLYECGFEIMGMITEGLSTFLSYSRNIESLEALEEMLYSSSQPFLLEGNQLIYCFIDIEETAPYVHFFEMGFQLFIDSINEYLESFGIQAKPLEKKEIALLIGPHEEGILIQTPQYEFYLNEERLYLDGREEELGLHLEQLPQDIQSILHTLITQHPFCHCELCRNASPVREQLMLLSEDFLLQLDTIYNEAAGEEFD